MNPRISIDFDVAEGAVIRMLGLIERRGFQVRGISMTEHDDGEAASMTVELAPRDSGRRVEILDLQLRRLQGVRSISTYASQTGATS